jgi:SAM-dependent methyltransferase
MDWQARYEAGDTPWDHGGPHPALIDFIAENGPLQGRILVPGCGPGHDVRVLSTGENRVTGIDIAPAAVAKARSFPPSAREEYAVADLFALGPEWRGAFDWVVEHTCFCAIDPAMRPAYVQAVAESLKPGGRLLAIFYLNPAADHQPPYGVTVAELDRFFTPPFSLIREWTPARTFEGRESRERVREHVASAFPQ